MEKCYILGSHNAWSYLRPKKWWMRILAFTARCQSCTIQEQYEMYGVRDFDLRVRFENDELQIVHGKIVYDYSEKDLIGNLFYLNKREDCSVRVILDVRNKKQYLNCQATNFIKLCRDLYFFFDEINFWGGFNLYDYRYEYDFPYKPTCDGRYSSMCKPRLLDDWWPWLYAKFHNRKILEKGTTADILHIDFVNIR